MTASIHQLRSTPRSRAEYPVVFAGAPFVGEGRLNDLSTGGCSIISRRTALTGSYIKLSILIPAQPAPLFIELGRIRWVLDEAFGVEFIRLPAIASQSLDRVSWGRIVSAL